MSLGVKESRLLKWVIMDKRCSVCHQEKPLDEFYNHVRSRDGKTSACKECSREAARRYRASPRGKATRRLRRIKDKQKIQARDAVSNAIKRGEMPRAQDCACAECGGTAVAYHHHRGYRTEHFLDVVPLCADCHQTAEDKTEWEDLGTEGLPLFEVG